uniref:DUF7745 domain-containing protein n=1 Tax=Fagus sylvatica TaxID=28930 RepID=A0A2N9IXB9_FAGSY
MRHWWTLLGEDDHADIVGIFGKFPPFMRLQVDRGLLEALASFWDPTHCCFSIGEVDLIPTMEEYAELLQLDSPFSETPIARPEETWRKANISLDLLTKYFSRSAFPAKLARDFIVGKKGWKKFRINAFKIAFAGIFLFPTSAGRIDLGVIPIVFSEGRSIIPAILCETVRSLSYCRRQGEGVPMFCTQLLQLWFCSHLQHFHRLQTPYHFERHTVSQTVQIALPFTGDSRAWALYLLDLPLSGWAWKVTWGPASWMPWTHCALFDGVPLPGVWGCTGHYPSLALRQFSGVQYPPRLGDLDAVTFDYIPGEDMWRLLLRIEDIWGGRLSEMVLIEEGSPGDSSVTSDMSPRGTGRLGSGCLVLRADPEKIGVPRNPPQFACHSLSDALALNRLTHGSKISRSGSPFALLRYVAMCASFYGAYVLKIMAECRCLTEAVAVGAIAGPHALDSCECMNIEDAMRASLRWLLLCLLGRSALASHTLGLAISQGRFLTVEPSSRFSGHPAGGWSIRITSCQVLPLEARFGPTFDLRTGSRVSGRFLSVDSKSSITGPPKTFP